MGIIIWTCKIPETKKMKFLVCLAVLKFAVAMEDQNSEDSQDTQSLKRMRGTLADVPLMEKPALYKKAAGEWYDDEATILKTIQQFGGAARPILKMIPKAASKIFSGASITHNYIWEHSNAAMRQVYGTVGFAFSVYAFLRVIEMGNLVRNMGLTPSPTVLIALLVISSLYTLKALNGIQKKALKIAGEKYGMNAIEEQTPRITVIEEDDVDAKHEMDDVAKEKKEQPFTCTKGHCLEEIKGNPPGYTTTHCDNCSKNRIQEDGPVHHCASCEYDICDNCYEFLDMIRYLNK